MYASKKTLKSVPLRYDQTQIVNPSRSSLSYKKKKLLGRDDERWPLVRERGDFFFFLTTYGGDVDPEQSGFVVGVGFAIERRGCVTCVNVWVDGWLKWDVGGFPT